MIGPEHADPLVIRRIARRVEDILKAARERERRGQSLALDIDARFRLQDYSAVQFQLASAILEEVGELRQEEVVSELLSLGLAAVLNGAAQASESGRLNLSLGPDDALTGFGDEPWSEGALVAHGYADSRTLN